MGIFDYEYLGPKHIKGFDTYKYSCIDNSPLSVYVSHPFWNWLVNFYPRWLAPNVLTLGGWMLVMGCFFLESALDYDLDRNSAGKQDPLPGWFWLLASVCTFAAHTMDGTDGKQARRIGASGPTGELFDHGLDSWSTVPFTITIFSVFGQGEYSVPNIRLLCVLMSVQLVFIVTHWEKYNTGILFLSWAYDASQYGLAAVYLWTWIVGYKWFHFYVIQDVITFAGVFEIGFYLCCIGSFYMSLCNMAEAKTKGTLQQPNFFEAILPLIPVTVLFVVSVAWGVLSDGLDRDPRMFYFTMGTVFSNIASRLIICQMSSSRAEVFNGCLAVYVAAAFMSIFFNAYEMAILRIVSVVILAAHLHYGICVVRQLCAHFKIHALDVEYLKAKKN